MYNSTTPDFITGAEFDLHKTNKYIYFKQNFVPSMVKPTIMPSKVLVNPNFNKKVFVNPNYKPVNVSTVTRKIHINPNVTSINLPKENGSTKIHINPKILKNVSGSLENSLADPPMVRKESVKQPITYSSKTKLIRKPVKEQRVERTRRSSTYSKFKIVKSSPHNKTHDVKVKNKLLVNTKYKLKRLCTKNKSDKYSPQTSKLKSRFKLDNRKKRLSSTSRPKFVFVNRFLNISDIAKKVPLRTKSLVNIAGIMYKNSPTRLQRTSLIQKDKRNGLATIHVKSLKKNTYKIIRKSEAKPNLETKKIISRYSTRKNISPEKLKKCNIPCPYYRKLGKCKGKDLGKCPRKHDPDQIGLCTKFLQGACIDPKCLLSHNVSPEKMPTCKYYLEGSCSRDNCSYLHVKINPKADICRDFLEGFCKKASKCDERHQFLCPDYEKKGSCVKPRCAYPHGKMVRKYSVFNKHKFAKKSSKFENTASTSKEQSVIAINKHEENVKTEIPTSTRYYSDQTVENKQMSVNVGSTSTVHPNKQMFPFRQKLGTLPSFISFADI